LGSLLDGVALGLRKLPGIHLGQFPRMADFALWATACETAFWPAGTFARAYQANRRAAVEDLIEADPVAARVREIMASRTTWSGSASDLLRAAAQTSDAMSGPSTGWPKNPRALAGRLRRAQTFLRTLGIEMSFGREGRTGTRTIRMNSAFQSHPVTTVCTVSAVCGDAPPGHRPRVHGCVNGQDDADGADGGDDPENARGFAPTQFTL
jgi:hypothetical protein